MKIKDTLNLGKTAFPMRAGLPNKEPNWQKDWADATLYEKRQELNEGKPSFMLHDGPPYANGNIHLGHSLNKISKDIIVRYKSMAGFRAPYVPGWDTHGLPIEQQLAKAGMKRKEMDLLDYLEECRKYAMKQVDMQRSDFKSLGVLADWDRPYLTLLPEYEAAQIRVFGKMAEKGYIYKGQKPIYWSPSSESSLAEAEIEYQDVRSASIFVAFKAKDTKGKLPEDVEFVIWTTTPWTIPSNLGIFAHPDYDYSVVAVNGRKFVIASEMLEAVAEKLEWENPEVLQTIKGSELEYMVAKHPFYDRETLIMNADYVTLDSGTGLVHVAPGHGEDDYFASRKYKLPVLSPIDNRGYYTDEAPGLEGLFYDEGNKVVSKWLEEKDALLKLEFFTHSYPHDWRTKKPVIFRATPQWFASIDDFRQNILDEVERVDWVIPWGKTRLFNMVRDRGDWVISRQRAWGVPLPIFYGENGEPIITPETTEHVAKLFAEFGSKVWFEREAKDLLPEGFTHPASPNGEFTKEKDIMDVWFDSGSSWNGVLNERDYLSFPADLYLEGSDQYRGWFNSSITTSVAVNGVAPYKAVLSQGFVLDGKGRKMSKSIGNTIVPKDVTKKFGADILRLWVASIDTESDVRVSMDILSQVSEVYRKIRNTLRFLIANTSDFNPKEDAIDFAELRPVDKYMLVKFNKLVKQIRTAYDNYSFMTVYKSIINFITNDLSSFYLDFAKDVVYIEAANSPERRSMQTVMYVILKDLVKILVPILPHTAEETWTYLEHEPENFAYLAEMPEAAEIPGSEELLGNWQEFLDFRDKILKALESAREAKLIGKSLEATVTIYPNEVVRTLLTAIDENVAQLLIVSNFVVANEPVNNAPESAMKFDDLAVLVEHAAGEVCDRCRRTDETVGHNANEHLKMLCEHCAHIVETEFPEILEEGFED
ncbi:isoleucine--tRNA ligase [Lactococcus lactis]|uniref:isoleucine--tRNA ligase n=1 Tax=Lactococcus lactis TaxID=1358 RepID=UPI00288D4BA0|nr:isoleucine--tRNA ligase [Lactococcus lactis]MDT2905745.1 isoleucine--tRNA ligase [Lactococcus lactis]MDT2910644.1 isoleucine--tRNA ligase [Lactococcus lactis]MDT2932280.1 isoleucine--tRNA ligase [Lactococcus lactis]MDT2937420.1 isoleucine--tRNA ligase [Lactococcus lactis]